MMKLRALIVDDEVLAQRRLRLCLGEIPGVEVVGTASTGEEAAQRIAQLHPDVVLLDIQMPGAGGMVLARALADQDVQVVFVTAFADHASAAFDLEATDYLLKPVRPDRIQAAIERVRRRRDLRSARERVIELEHRLVEARGEPGGYDQALWVPQRDGQVRLPVSQITRIEASKDYALIHTPSRTHIMRITMSELERRLDPAVIMRVHRSAFVRLETVRRVECNGRGLMRLHVEDGAVIDVGPTYAKLVNRRLGLGGGEAVRREAS